jgi:ligand-binding sensor domain-containing protein/signal transduction histidine kinase
MDMNRSPLHQSNALKAIVLGLCIIATEPSVTRAERLPVKTYTTADGLVSNRISRIVQDSHGYLWFCTENGLSRFDGYRFTNYTSEQGLPDDEVNDLLETRGGNYWIATGSGLVRYNPKGLPLPNGQVSLRSDPMFVVYRLGRDRMTSNIKALYEDRSGTIWIGTWRGLYRLELIGDQALFHFMELGMPVSEPQTHVVRNILEDRRGALWLTTDSGLYKRRPDGTVDRFTRNHGFSSERLMGLVEDRQGRLWVGDRFGGLCLLVADPIANNPVVARQYAIKDGLGCVRVGSLYEATDGRFWIGVDCGLAELLPNADSASREISVSLSSEQLTDPRVWSLAEDSHGNLWVGTANGAIKVARGGFTTYTEADGLGSRHICSMMESRSGEFCVHTRSDHQAFINRFDGKRFIPTKLNLPSQVRPENCAHCLWDREGRWWMTLTGQLLRFPKSLRVDKFGRLRPEGFYPGITAQARGQIASLYEDRRGDLWISTTSRLQLLRWDRRAAEVHTYSETEGLPPTGNAANLYAEDRAGNLWLSYGDAGLVRYANDRFKLFTSADWLPAGTIKTLFVDSKGRLWIGFSQGGLARIDGPAAERPTPVIYTVAEGLSSNRVRSIVEDNWGRLYIGTDHSLDRLDPATGRIRHFTTADGLANNQVISGFRDSQGALWFSTNTGLSRLIPEPDRPQSPPVALINRLQISGSPYSVSDLGEASVSDLELAWNQGNIQIEFGGVAFGAGERLRYQHKLEGVDQVWSPLSEQRAVHLANLSPGRYRFLVRAVNADGVVSETPASFSFMILSPVWRRWGFLALAATMLGLAVYTAYRYRVAQLLKLERMRTRIATDLHDDIGSSLSQIAILSEVSRRRLGEQQDGVGESLAQIANTSRDLVDSMSDIVWAINPRRDRLSDLAQRMREFAGDVFTAREIEFSFRAPAGGPELRLDADVRRQLYLIFKEAVNNAARHSRCTQAEIELDVAQGYLLLHVRDNGRGFDPNGDAATSRNGNGLASMRERARALGGEIEIISQANLGAAVKLNLPLGPRAGSRWRRYLPV